MINKYSSIKFSSEIAALCQAHKFLVKVIGEEIFNKKGKKLPIYKIVLNPKSKIKFCLIAGVHGDEVAGPMTILKALETPDKFFDKRIGYEIFPLLNPTGFDLGQRNDDDNCNLNRLNKNTLNSDNYKEIQALHKSIKNQVFGALISLHEDLTQDKFYAYVFEKKVNPLYREIVTETSKRVAIWKSKKIYGVNSNGNGLVINYQDQSIEDRLFQLKQAKISMATETPGKLPLQKRILINLGNIKIVNKYLVDTI